ncbi:hypothetical protein ER308_09185 [Egibacter rhizosphaerae]|uniref:ABC transporter permease n=1 Tax=Egibacter rhizosphaerae TaxID=1670831 RepID=A0A411YF07_9ACTN|nr:hypothetical protein [Egibacter rhizosphaerae]QBI19702.1 hypothetical protein ER308_09185 [Egibacter rhizosphaerae]
MTRLVHAELIKLTSVRTPWVLAVAMVTLAVMPALAFAAVPEARAELGTAAMQLEILRGGDPWMFAAILGVLLLAGEHRQSTIIPAALVAPRRWPLVPAKVVVAMLGGVALVAISAVSAAGLLAATLAIAGEPFALSAAETAGVLGRSALFAALMGVVGLGLGEVLRSQIAGIVALLVIALLVGPAMFALNPFDLGWWLPTGLEIALVSTEGGMVSMGGPGALGEAPFGALGAGLVLTSYASVAAVAAAISLVRRELG